MPAEREQPVYVYGVVPGDATLVLSADGIEGSGRPRLVRSGGVAAIAAEAKDEAVATTRRNLNAHAEVLSEAARATTVLPMRFGVVFPSEDRLEDEFLGPMGPRLGALLGRYAGKVEVTLRGSFEDQDAVLREVAGGEPEIIRLRDQVRNLPDDAAYFARIRLGELVAQGLEARRGAEEQRILQRLEPLATAVERDPELPERIVLRAAFLLERNRLPEFDGAVDTLAQELSGWIRFSYAGPLALHSFVDLAPREEAAWVS